ncbi:hypothetical protein ABZ671_29780 [Micromonospora sp. NPDC006766]|uniref:hypothetical protein n=1 Tax=Micromonospora sp. NPDC006766 TaxID=3154778 RepID=UPI0033E4809E
MLDKESPNDGAFDVDPSLDPGFQDDEVAEPADTPEVPDGLDQAGVARLLTSVGHEAEPSSIDLGLRSYDGARWFSIIKVHHNGKKERVGILPDYAVPLYVEELNTDWVVSEGGLSLTSSDGRYVELMLSPRLARFAIRTIVEDRTYSSPRLRCSSAAPDEDHGTSFRTALGRRDVPLFERGRRYARISVVLHVGNGKGDCLEISTPSATMAAGYYRAANGVRPPDLRRAASIKLRFTESRSRENAIKRAEEVAETLFFEMAATGRSVLRLHERLTERRRRLPRQRDGESVLRFPPQIVDTRASSLFIGAEQATSPLSTYLSYYQSIEFFLPFSDERNTIVRLRQEIFSPGFDLGNDASLLKLARAVGRQASPTERESFQALLSFALPKDKALATFESVDGRHKDHFSKRGPIKDVGLINPLDKRPLAEQIAERIYDLRCRIVHSKVSGGVSGTEPLFPTDAQVDHLEADIELVRLVAVEVITVFATPNFKI